MVDIFAKYAGLSARRGIVETIGRDPFGVAIDELLSPTEAIIEGRPTILLGTNNYLGLTLDAACQEAAVSAVREHGTGTTGSRIANGTYPGHRELETAFARFLDKRHCMVFTTGYQANLAMISGLAGRDDVIFIDADSHASIYDGCALSGAKVIRFRHNDPGDLDRRLARQDKGQACLVVVEGLYSIMGDTAPLPELIEVKRRHGAYLMVDEAHSFGVFGPSGRGVAEAQGVDAGVDFTVGTFSKSLGAIGGFAASDHPAFDLLRYVAHPYMFTASPSPADVAAARAALARIESDPGLRERVWRNGEQLHEGLSALGFAPCAAPAPVIALRLADEAAAVRAWSRLIELGVYVNLALPPGTPGGLHLLRCSVSAAHTPAQLDEVCRRFGLLAAELSRAGQLAA